METKLFPSVLRPLVTTQPALTAMYATGRDERLRRYYSRLSRYLVWAFLLAGLPMIVYREELWSLYLREKHATYSTAGFTFSRALATDSLRLAPPSIKSTPIMAMLAPNFV